MDTRDLENIGPEERIKRIQELEVQKRSEINVLRKLLAQALAELNMKLEKEAIPIQQVTSTHITNLVSEEEREMFRAKHFVAKHAAASDETGGEKGSGAEAASEGAAKRLEEAVLDERPAVRRSSRNQDYQPLHGSPMPSYRTGDAMLQATMYQPGQDVLVDNIIALTELDYRLTKEERLSKHDLREFYRIKSDVEKVRQQEFKPADELLLSQINVSEKLINKIRYNL